MRLAAFWLSAFLALSPAAVHAQTWSDSAVIALVSRAVARRTVAQGDSGLQSWHVRAHGVVLFLAQVGEGGTGTSRLVKGDELDVEVYWSAPGRSKQVIRGWRDRRYLPTDIRYHRDHLGIVTDGYGPRIRIGEGDEVRDVVHPLSEPGLAHYEFLRRDSAEVSAGARSITLEAVDVRPRDPATPGVVGTIYLDRTTAELVRARWSFTPGSYLDRTIEDLTVLLDYALIEERAWLPWKQTIEIRRNAGWLDLPYRGIIRATWDFGEYDLDAAIEPRVFIGIPIGGLRQPGDSAGPWPASFDSVLAAAGPAVSEREVAQARVEVARAIEGRFARGARPTRLAATRLSDILRYDRVQGVAFGAGMTVAGRGSRVTFRPSLGVGLADGRLTGGFALARETRGPRPATVAIHGVRSVRDLSDLAVISPILNSLTAQEAGDDHGDYVLVEGAGLKIEWPWAPASRLSVRFGWEDPAPLGIAATPARGTFRPQVDLGAPGYWTGGAMVQFGEEEGPGLRLTYDGGTGGETWHRVTARYEGALPFHGTEVRLRGYLGAATTGTPDWRTFVLGGRGTLLGEEYRKWGGRAMAWQSIEWRIPVPFPAIPLGDFATTGHQAWLAPFITGGWAGEGVPGMPWRASPGTRHSAGVALELFYQLFRIEGGVSLETGEIGVTFDLGRAWWRLL